MSIAHIKHVTLKYVPLTDEVKKVLLEQCNEDKYIYFFTNVRIEDGNRFLETDLCQPNPETDIDYLQEKMDTHTHVALITIPRLPIDVLPQYVETDEQQADKLLRKAKRLTAPKKGGKQ